MQPADKASLRAAFGARRRHRTPEQLAELRAAIRTHVLGHCTWTSVAGYAPMRTEPGSNELLEQLQARGVQVIVPLVLDDRDLDWTRYADTQPLGVDTIARVDAVLVPALAVARDGTRLGRGGGSYDRALARVATGTQVVALLFDDELVEELPREQWDVPVSAVVTPSGWHPVGESGGQPRS